MLLRLNRSSPTPLYHQIVQAIRWRIGTGELRAGDPLPAVREAADRWGVNYHTVRRAYQELAELGWIETVQGAGTTVATAPPLDGAGAEDDLEQWLEEVVATAKDRYRLTPVALAQRIWDRGRVPRVVMVECNAHQATFLAEQLEEAWPVEAIAWSLDDPGDPPELPLIGTYFHHVEMRARWPHRAADMRFVALWLDRGLEKRIEAIASRRPIRRLHLVEQNPGTAEEMAAGVSAEEMAAGVSALLSPRFTVTITVGDPAELLPALEGDELLLVAPRLWDRLPAAVREDERVLDVRHVIVPEELDRVWGSLVRAGAAAGKPFRESSDAASRTTVQSP
jgi:DNA-binding transcriptional regulator YhcF (GntR family)